MWSKLCCRFRLPVQLIYRAFYGSVSFLMVWCLYELKARSLCDQSVTAECWPSGRCHISHQVAARQALVVSRFVRWRTARRRLGASLRKLYLSPQPPWWLTVRVNVPFTMTKTLINTDHTRNRDLMKKEPQINTKTFVRSWRNRLIFDKARHRSVVKTALVVVGTTLLYVVRPKQNLNKFTNITEVTSVKYLFAAFYSNEMLGPKFR